MLPSVYSGNVAPNYGVSVTNNNGRPFWYDPIRSIEEPEGPGGWSKRQKRRDPANQTFQKYLEATLGHIFPSYPLGDPFEQTAHYRGTVYLGIQTLMNAMSGCTILLEQKRDGSSGWPAPGVSWDDDEYIPFEDHQLVGRLRRPNPTDTFASFIQQCILQYHLTGRLMIWGAQNSYDLPVRFYVLPTALCTPAFGIGNDLYPLGAWMVQQYYPASGLMGILPGPLAGTAGAIIDAREVYIMQNPHPFYKWACFSPLVGVDTEVDVLEMIDRSAWSIYRNGVNPSGILGAPGAGEQQVADLESRINNKYAGPDNAGKVWVIGQRPDSRGIAFTPTRPGAVEMAFETRAVFESLILAAVCGLDRRVCGLESTGGYAERWAAIQDVRVRKYEPWLGMVADLITNGPVRQWGLADKGIRCSIRLPRMSDPTMIQTDTNAGASDQTMSTDEIRSRRGQGPDELGLGAYPPAIRTAILQTMMESGQLKIQPSPQMLAAQTGLEQMQNQDIPDPTADTALGTLVSNFQRADDEPSPAGKSGGKEPPRPRNKAGKGSLPSKVPVPPKPDSGGKKRGKKAIDPRTLTYRQVLETPEVLDDPHTARLWAKRLVTEWSATESPGRKVRVAVRHILPHTTTGGLLADFHPGEVTVHRGHEGDTLVPGTRSWSTREDVARGFGPTLTSRTITPDIPALSLDKVLGEGHSEAEVILHTPVRGRKAADDAYLADSPRGVKSSEDEERGFRTHLAAHPDDDNARLVYADWLDDQGREHEAAAHRFLVSPNDRKLADEVVRHHLDKSDQDISGPAFDKSETATVRSYGAIADMEQLVHERFGQYEDRTHRHANNTGDAVLSSHIHAAQAGLHRTWAAKHERFARRLAGSENREDVEDHRSHLEAASAHRSAAEAHALASAVHRARAPKGAFRNIKADDAVTGTDVAGSLIAPPAQTKPRRRKRRVLTGERAEQVRKSIVDRVLNS